MLLYQSDVNNYIRRVFTHLGLAVEKEEKREGNYAVWAAF